MFLLGIFFVFLSLLILAVAELYLKMQGTRFLAVLIVFVGLVFIFGDGITKLNLPGGYGFEKVTSKAVADADAIATVKKRVEDQSATVDAIASKASEASDLSRAAEVRLIQSKKKIDDLDALVKKASATLARLQSSAELTTFISDAQDDDRDALNSLEVIAKDSNDPRSSKAETAWSEITVSAYTALQLNFPVPWSAGVDASKLDLWQLESAYDDATNQPAKIAILQYIAARQDFKEVDKLDYFVKIASVDRSIKNASYAFH